MKSAFLLLICFNCSAVFGQSKAHRAAMGAHVLFSMSMTNGEYEQAAEKTAEQTRTYLDNWLQHALHSDSATVAELPVLLRIGVLNYRHRTTPETAHSADYRQFFAFLCTLDLISPKAFAGSSSYSAEIKKSEAIVTAYQGESQIDQPWPYVLEAKQWKINLVPLLETATEQMNAAFAGQMLPPNDLIFLQMHRMTGRQPSPNIWQPILEN